MTNEPPPGKVSLTNEQWNLVKDLFRGRPGENELERLVEESPLGTPGAKAVRDRVPRKDAEAVVARLVADKELSEFKEFLGEGIHTAFRKASDSSEANQIWHLIEQLPPEEWDALLSFIAKPVMDYVKAACS